MPRIADVDLNVEAHGTDSGGWDVNVTYRILFAEWERGAWVEEHIEIFPSDANGRDAVLVFRHPPWQLRPIEGAAREGEFYVIDRSVSARRVSAKALDVNPDLPGVLLSFRGPLSKVEPAILLRADALRAVVKLAARALVPATGISQELVGQFGVSP